MNVAFRSLLLLALLGLFACDCDDGDLGADDPDGSLQDGGDGGRDDDASDG